jgi:prepilin-type N-terminal cleavage/methylation domain-containing protein
MKFKGMKQAGFSLVELMVVVGIIGILAAIAVPKLQQFTAKAKQSEARIGLKNVDTMQQAFYAENSRYGTGDEIGGVTTMAGKNYGAPAVTFATASPEVYSATMTSLKRLCPGSTNANDVWTVNQTGALSNSTPGITGC